MSAARRLTLMTLGLLCALAGALLCGGAVAQAAFTHEAISRITEVPATGPLGEPTPFPGPFRNTLIPITVDSGELYLAEEPLDKFDTKTGAFVSQFEKIPSPYGYLSESVAVGHSTGETEIYDTGDDLSNGAKGVVAVYNGSGHLQGVWTGADTPSKEFACFDCGVSADVAVDNSVNPFTKGDVYVDSPQQGVVDVFAPKAGGGEEYLTQLTGPEPEAHPEVHFHGLPYSGAAVSAFNGDVFVIDGQSVDVFEPTALKTYTLVRRLTGTTSGPFEGSPYAVAVDGANGEVFTTILGGAGLGVIDQFNAEGKFVGQFQMTGQHGSESYPQLGPVAVDPESGDVYVGASENNSENTRFGFVQIFGPNIVIPVVTTEPASKVTPASATLNGTVNPDSGGEATCRFEWGTSTSFGNAAPCEPEGVAEGGAPVAVHATLNGLQPDTTYYYRLQATNRADGKTNYGEAAQNRTFATPGPGLHGESATNVAATSATLDASIDPNEAPTAYYFQYGTTTAYGIDVPAAPGASIGSGKGDEEVARHLQGLSPGTVYHYRVVAVSELAGGEIEVVEGADQTFKTQPAGFAFSLPDNRQWEMVSPPDKHGAEIQAFNPEGSAQQASANGDAMTYVSNAPMASNPLGYAEVAQSLSLRGPEGWVTHNISPPHLVTTGTSIGVGQEYRLFSEDLSLSVVHPFGGSDPKLSPEASEPTAYLRTDFMNGNVDEPCLSPAMSCYRPLVTGKPGYANVPAGTVFGEEVLGEERECLYGNVFCGPEIVAATPDLGHILLSSKVPLTPGGGNLYEWAAGKLTNVGDARRSGERAISPLHGLSDDGSRVIFESGNGKELLMYDASTGETVRLDGVQGGTGEGRTDPIMQAASSDGSRVFFTDQNQLTADSHQNPVAPSDDLYECAMVETGGKLGCRLSNLTPEGTGEPSRVVGSVLGAGEDGSYVYFVADGALAEGAVPGRCAAEAHGTSTCDLYVRHDGTTKLIAALSQEDYPDWAAPPGQTARVSPNGQWLAFMSQQDLTGYVSRDAITGEADEEVYLYDAVTGKLLCASCNPTGARPVGLKSGQINKSNGQEPIVDSGAWEGGVAANIPGWTPDALDETFYQSRYLSDSGRLFFNSSDALAPQDVNGAEDVYEYEPPGVGTCATSTATYSERSAGCIDLVSSGTSGEESAFLDASGDGSDVFFLTAAKLTPQDYDTALDVYDARECTGAADCYPVPPSVPPPCDTGDACKPSPTPQPAIFGSPSSATFSGAGNIPPSAPLPAVRKKSLTRAQRLAQALRACRARHRVGSRSACERRARARYASAKSRGANKASGKGGRG